MLPFPNRAPRAQVLHACGEEARVADALEMVVGGPLTFSFGALQVTGETALRGVRGVLGSAYGALGSA